MKWFTYQFNAYSPTLDAGSVKHVNTSHSHLWISEGDSSEPLTLSVPILLEVHLEDVSGSFESVPEKLGGDVVG